MKNGPDTNGVELSPVTLACSARWPCLMVPISPLTLSELLGDALRSSHEALCHSLGWKFLWEAAYFATEADVKPVIATTLSDVSGESCAANDSPNMAGQGTHMTHMHASLQCSRLSFRFIEAS